MAQRLRIFISSPADVPDERLRAALIVDKLSQDYGRFFTIESYRWEHEAMLASAHFQDAIEPPSAFDIVVLILWSRLGTPLPERTGEREYRGIDGRAPVTGTEWEYEEALAVAREKKAPDLLAFRNISPAPIDPRDPAAQAASMTQLGALNDFWKRHFADKGVFLAAYDEYRTLEEFAQRLEESLRRLIERRIKEASAGKPRAEPVWLGEPFRGLEPYEFEHAPIFFGRDAAIAKATEQLAANVRAGHGFLLLSGASGSGKSSLAKAGIVPRLMKPQRISGAAFLRRVAFRPGSEGNDVFVSLANALTRAGTQDVGLPELIARGQDATQLALHLRSAAGEPGYLFGNALGRLTEAARQSGRILAFEEAKLILVVDQLEELFTASGTEPQERSRFIQLLGGLARSGAVLVIATLRADFWHRAADIPELVALAEGQGRIDLAAPSAAELAEMIRKPAQAAGLSFEAHPQSGLGLDAVLAQDAAAEPGALPLLSFTLDELYRSAKARGEAVLTHASYAALGGIGGAIAKRADEVMASLPAAAQAALPRVLRVLTTVSETAEQTPVARAASLESFPEGSPARTLIDAFIAARLLVATDESGAGASVRLAHEALIGRWQRARDQLVIDRRDLATRTLVDRQYARWCQARGRARRLLLLRNPDLANAADLARRWGDELHAPVRDFVQRSARRARLTQTLTAAAAVLFALVAGAAIFAEREAVRERELAEKTLAAATATANGLVFDLAQRFRNTIGVPAALIKDILDKARALQEQLIKSGQVSRGLEYSEAAALIETVDTSLKIGDTAGALAAAEQARQIMAGLLAGSPNDTDYQNQLAVADAKIGDVKQTQGDLDGALKSYRDSLAISERTAQSDPDNAEWQDDVSASEGHIGDVQKKQGDLAGALKSYQAELAIMERLAQSNPGNTYWQRELAVAHDKSGDVQQAQGDLAGALKSYRKSLAIQERLAQSDPTNAELQSDLSASNGDVGDVQQAQGDLAGALKSYRDSFAIVERLVQSDPDNAGWQHDLSVSYDNIGGVQKAQGDLAGALKSEQAALAIMQRLAQSDPNNAEWQDELATAYNNVGNMQKAQGDLASALKSYRDSLATMKRLAQSDPGNADWQDDLAISYNSVGDVQKAQGNLKGALQSYRDSLAIMERLAQSDHDSLRLMHSDSDNAGWQDDLALTYGYIGNVQKAQGDLDGALKSYRDGLAIMERLAQSDPGNAGWQDDLATTYGNIGYVQEAQGDLDGALKSYHDDLAITERLAQSDPRNATWQHELSMSYIDVGGVQQAQGDLAGALESDRGGLAIMERLAQSDPDNAEWQRDLAVGYGNIADLYSHSNDRHKSLAALRLGQAIMDRLVRLSPHNADWKKDLGWFNEQIATLTK